MMTLPDWLTRQLIANGTLTHTGISRHPRYRRCPHHCGAVLLAAIDDLGFESWVHPAPTTITGELQAVLAGRTVHTRIGDELVHRGAARITYKSADEEPAYPDHECGDYWPINPKWAPKQNTVIDDNTLIPF